jgi:hypothetical protein
MIFAALDGQLQAVNRSTEIAGNRPFQRIFRGEYTRLRQTPNPITWTKEMSF